MHLSTVTVPSDFELILLGDTHDGTILQHRDGLKQVIDYIASKRNVYWGHMGDEVEAIMVDDKRYDPETVSEAIPMRQRDNVIKDFKPIAKKCLWWLWGNHPQKLYRFGNITLDICEALGIEYGTWTTKVSFNDKHGQMFKAFLCHGVRGRMVSNAKDYEQRQANLKASLKQKLKEKAADCVLMGMGHTHLLLKVDPAPKLYMVDDGQHIKQRYLTPGTNESYIDPDRRWYVNTGSFLKTYGHDVSGYAECAGYDPVEFGCVKVIVKNRAIANVDRWVL